MHAGCYVSGRNRLGEGGLREGCLFFFFLFKMKMPTKFWLLTSLWKVDEMWILPAIEIRKVRREGRVRMNQCIDILNQKGEGGLFLFIFIHISIFTYALTSRSCPTNMEVLWFPFQWHPCKWPWNRNLQSTWGMTETYAVPMSAPQKQWSSQRPAGLGFPFEGGN